MAQKRQIEKDNYMAHLQGVYFVEALMSTVGNMLGGKNSKKHEYPAKPYEINLDEEKKQSEIERKRELFAANLTAAMINFNLSKEKG